VVHKNYGYTIKPLHEILMGMIKKPGN